MKNQVKLTVIICQALLIAFSTGLMAQTINPQKFSEQVNHLFAEQVKATEPGAAVVVTVKGKPIFKECYGLADVEHNVPITPKTMFNLASVSKQFTAFSILLLEKEGKINLEDDIHKYLPDLPDYGKSVTIRNLINHTSGIWEYYSTMVYYCGYNRDDHFTLDEDMALLKQQKELLFDPGSDWSYCNANYLLLAQIVEKVTGKYFQEWTENNIFDPIGMNSSFFMKNSSQIIMGKAEPYKKYKNDLVRDNGPWTNAVGMGYLFTNIDDMILWMDNFRTRKIGGGNLIARMFQKAKLNNGNESFYGFGLGIMEREGRMTIGHSGQTAGYKSAMLYCPEIELGITILANLRSIDTEGLCNKIFDLYTVKTAGAETVSGKKQDFIPFDAESAARFTGGYIVEGDGAKMAVNLGKTSLHGAFWGKGEDFFYPQSATKFANRRRVNFLEFVQDEDSVMNKVSITIRQDKKTAHRIMLDEKFLEAHISDYIGSYYSESFGIVYKFLLNNDQPIMYHRRYGERRMQPIDKDEFLFISGFVKFNRNIAGEVTGFTLTPSDEDFCFQGVQYIKIR